ncbi:MAG: cupin domain-containing protein [Draconibacterium sp.]
MFTKSNSSDFKLLIEGVKMRPLVWEQKTLLCEFQLEKGNTIPPHQHPYEQTGMLISGKLNFRINNEWHLAGSGDSWSVPENVEHEVEILENSVLIELFSPIRKDYLP